MLSRFCYPAHAFGGLQRYSYEAARHLVAKGATVDVYCEPFSKVVSRRSFPSGWYPSSMPESRVSEWWREP